MSRIKICPESASALERIRQAAKKDKALQFTTLYHHIHDVTQLRAAYYALKRTAAPGLDGITWKMYGEELEVNLADLSERLKRGAYRAVPVLRVHIPKADGRQRPIGLLILEDKIVQRATAEVLNAVYEQDFLGFSYGFRQERNQHQALDAVTVGIMRKKVSWVLDADIRAFFDTLNHVFDLWVQWWRKQQARGDVIAVRFADDWVVGFQYRYEAERFLSELRERFAKFGLELHPDKTRLLEFGRFAAQSRKKRGEGKPATFNFLGFTHICGKTRKGKFTVVRKTMRKKWQAKLKEVKIFLRRRMHDPVPEQGVYLRAVIRGHMQYYGVPMNNRAISAFRHALQRIWWKTLKRRSQKHNLKWDRMGRLVGKWFPPVRICHPYPSERLRVIT